MQAESTSLRDGVLTLAGIALLLAFLRTASEIVVPFLFSLFITTIAATPLQWLKQRGVSNAWSIVIVMVSIVVVLVLIATMLGNTTTQFNQALPGYQARLGELANEMSTWLAAKGMRIDDSGILDVLDPAQVMAFANTFVSGIGDALSNAMLILFMVIFMLSEALGFPRKLSAVGGDDASAALKALTEITGTINRYAAAKAAVSLATGILIWIALEIIGLDFAPLWGFVAFILNFVPNVGSILAAVPAVLLAMLQLDPVMVLVVIGVYLAVNIVIGNVVEPMVMGQRVGLSILAVFLSLLFWGWMFGAVGMLLSIPLTMVVKFAAQAHPQTRWLAVLLGPAPVDETAENEMAVKRKVERD